MFFDRRLPRLLISPSWASDELSEAACSRGCGPSAARSRASSCSRRPAEGRSSRRLLRESFSSRHTRGCESRRKGTVSDSSENVKEDGEGGRGSRRRRRRRRTPFMPRQFLGPVWNGFRASSWSLANLGSPIHRSGWNSKGFAKFLSLW